MATVLAGCSTIAERTPSVDVAAQWEVRQSQLIPLKSWEIQGRVSARAPGEGWQASLRWVRDDERHEIDLWGPLGRGHVRLVQDQFGAQLVDADRNTYWADSSERLLYDATGWRLPLQGLNYWVLGVPVPETPGEQTLDERGRLTSLEQLGWQIRFLRYQRHGTYEFPSKLFIRRQIDGTVGESVVESSQEDGLLEVRLVIQRWTTTP